jgi:AsmA protein
VRKSLKIILSIVAGLVLLVVLAVSAALLFINPNSFKPKITTAVKNKIGRDLVIEGDVKLAFFPTLGINTGKMTLSNVAGFDNQAFASLEASHISVELLPLLSKKIEVSGIVLTNLTLNLVKNQQGVKNWADLVAHKPTPIVANTTPSPQPTITNALATFAIGAVTLDNAQINWQNQQTGKNLLFKELNLTTDKVSFNQPVAVDLAFVMENAASKVSETIKLNTLLTINEQFDTLALSHSNLQTTTVGESVPNKSLITSLIIADSAISLPQQTAKITGLQLQSGDLTLNADLSGEHLKDNLTIHGMISVAQFSPAKLMKELAITAPVIRDANALNKLVMSANFTATKNSLDLQNLILNLDETTIKGTTNIKNFAAPAITFNLAIDSLDVDRYLPPVEKTNKPVTSPTIALMAGAKSIPVESLRKLNIDGNLTATTLKINDLNLQDVQQHLTAKDGLVTSTQTVKQFYQGEYTGNLVVDARNAQTVLAIDEKLSHVQVEPLLQDFRGKATLRGTLDAASQLHAKGNTGAELKASLNGFLKFVCKDGAVLGFSLQKMVDKGKALLKGTDAAVNNDNEQTPFVEISATAVVNNGLITNNDLLARTNKIRVTGNGTASLITEQLDYKLTTLLLKEKATATEPEQFHETPMIIAVGGTFSKPTYTLDLAALLTEKNKAKVENILNNVKTEENKAKIQQALDNLKPEQKEKLQKLAPKLGKLFKKLF